MHESSICFFTQIISTHENKLNKIKPLLTLGIIFLYGS